MSSKNLQNKQSSFPERLSELLDHLGWKQVDLCRKTGIAESTISRLMRGGGNPGNRTIAKIANLTGCQRAWLIDGQGLMFDPEKEYGVHSGGKTDAVEDRGAYDPSFLAADVELLAKIHKSGDRAAIASIHNQLVKHSSGSFRDLGGSAEGVNDFDHTHPELDLLLKKMSQMEMQMRKLLDGGGQGLLSNDDHPEEDAG